MTGIVGRLAFVLAGGLVACGGGPLERLADEPLVPTRTISAPTKASPEVPLPPEAGAEITQAPWPPEENGEPRARALGTACGRPDGALARVARDVASARARGLGTPDADRVAWLLRSAGVPHVRPRVLTASGRSPIDAEDLRARIAALATPLGVCGVALERTPHGGEVVVAIAVDALADLAPLPQRARAGEWLGLEAKLLVPATSARVLVTGPRGAPRAVPATLDAERGVVRARFALDRQGAFLVQVVADVEGGPRPVLEANVGAGAAKTTEDEAPAPGEEPDAAEDAPSLARMVDVLRASENLAPLARDARLDTIARAHAEHMARLGAVAHDVGAGDLRSRAGEKNLGAHRVGENVARATTLSRAHRALHASPSHRQNLLDVGFTRVGVGVRRAEDGFVYVCQVFASD